MLLTTQKPLSKEQIILIIPLNKKSNIVIKRSFDIIFSLTFLILFFPLVYLLVGLAIKLDSHGPILFIQKRKGLNGQYFSCYKFRSMYKNLACKQASKKDPRITRIGKLIRKTNIDELPQFINVLSGNMSLVGPRPHPQWLNEQVSDKIPNYNMRSLIKPGITGLAQISGFRGETSTLDKMEGRVERDLWYIENWSMWLDIKIIWRTVILLFKGDKNAY